MTNPVVRVVALAALAGLVSTAAFATKQESSCSRSSRLPRAGATKGQVPQMRKGGSAEIASAKQRRQRGPRISWQAVA